MANVEVLGQQVETPPARTLLLLAGAGALIGFVLLRKSSPAPATQGNAPSPANPEFLAVVADANRDIAQLTASNRLQEKQLDYNYQLAMLNAPRNSRQCIPFSEWRNLSMRDRKVYQQQVRNGKLIQVPSPNGICFIPTQSGVSGHAPLVTTQTDAGFFSSESRITGPAGSYDPSGASQQKPSQGPGFILGLLDLLARIFQPFFPTSGGM